MYARTILRKPNPNKLNKDDLAKVAVTLWSLHVPKADEVIFRDPKVSEKDDFKDKTDIVRQVYIKLSVIAEFGRTRGCPKYDHELSDGPGRTSRPQSQRCRARIIGSLRSRQRKEKKTRTWKHRVINVSVRSNGSTYAHIANHENESAKLTKNAHS